MVSPKRGNSFCLTERGYFSDKHPTLPLIFQCDGRSALGVIVLHLIDARADWKAAHRP